MIGGQVVRVAASWMVGAALRRLSATDRKSAARSQRLEEEGTAKEEWSLSVADCRVATALFGTGLSQGSWRRQRRWSAHCQGRSSGWACGQGRPGMTAHWRLAVARGSGEAGKPAAARGSRVQRQRQGVGLKGALAEVQGMGREIGARLRAVDEEGRLCDAGCGKASDLRLGVWAQLERVRGREN